MESRNFDLNIQKYTLNDLFVLFKIEDRDTITDEKVKQKYEILKKVLIGNEKLSRPFRQNLSVFLDKANERLCEHVQHNNVITKNTAPYSYDTTPNSIYTIQSSQNSTEGSTHSVIVPKVIPVHNTSEYKYPTGVFNGIEKRVMTKVVNIDTLFRENYSQTSPSSFTWTFPEHINNVVSMNVSTIEIPNVWYALSQKQKNNFFNIILYNMTTDPIAHPVDPVTHTIQIPEGNYMSDEFMTAFNNYCINVSGGLEYITCDINPNTAKTIIRATRDGDNRPMTPKSPFVNWPEFYFELDFFPSTYTIIDEHPCELIPSDQKLNKDVVFYKNKKICLNSIKRVCIQNIAVDDIYVLQNTLGWFMGFRKKTYVVTKNDLYVDLIVNNGTSNAYQGYLASEAMFGSGVDNYVFVEIDDYNYNHMTDTITSALPNSTYLGRNIIARIPVTIPHNNMLFDSTTICKVREYLGPVKIQKLNVRLLNRFGKEIDLNDNNWSIALNFEVLYS